MENEIDYFDSPYFNEVPHNIVDIIDLFEELDNEGEYNIYELCADFVDKLEQNGWTCQYGLDGEPFGLRPLFPNELNNRNKTNQQETALVKQPKALI